MVNKLVPVAPSASKKPFLANKDANAFFFFAVVMYVQIEFIDGGTRHEFQEMGKTGPGS